MRATGKAADSISPANVSFEPAPIGDLRFRALMPAGDWERLPAAIRRRFSKRLAGGETIIYAGQVVENRFSPAGWLLAQALRLIGGPLPFDRDVPVPGIVAVTEDKLTNGQIWTRLYARRRHFPHVIHSSKRFSGPTGLEEYVGRGIGLALTVSAESEALVFRSAFYFALVAGRRFKLPDWMTPGSLVVIHSEEPDGRFAFTLELHHPWLGLLLRQTALFRDTVP